MHFGTILLKNIPQNEIGLIGDVKGVLDGMLSIVNSDTEKQVNVDKILLNCHVITRLIARYTPGLRVVDGWYYTGWARRDNSEMCEIAHCSHSWLVSDSGKTLIDPYPVDLVAVGTVIAMPIDLPDELHDTPYHGAMKYLEGPIEHDLFDMTEILLNVYKFEASLKMILRS